MSQHYAYRVVFSQEDGEWVGLCAEFPSLSHLAATQVEAMQGIVTLVSAVVEDMIEAGEALPEAMSDRQYSGSFVTRVPGQLHRALAIEAAEAGVSLNRLVAYKLAIPALVAGNPTKSAAARTAATTMAKAKVNANHGAPAARLSRRRPTSAARRPTYAQSTEA